MVFFGFALNCMLLAPLFNFLNFLRFCFCPGFFNSFFSASSLFACSCIIESILFEDLFPWSEFRLLFLEFLTQDCLSLLFNLLLLLDLLVHFQSLKLVQSCPFVNLWIKAGHATHPFWSRFVEFISTIAIVEIFQSILVELVAASASNLASCSDGISDWTTWTIFHVLCNVCILFLYLLQIRPLVFFLMAESCVLRAIWDFSIL